MKKEKRPGGGQSLIKRLSGHLHSTETKCLLIVLIGALLICGMVLIVATPQTYDLRVGSISKYTITATRDVVDEVATQERRDAAAAAVENSYRYEEGVDARVMGNLAACFDELRNVRQYGSTLLSDREDQTEAFSDDELAWAQSLVTTVTLTNYQLDTLLRTSQEDFEEMVTQVTTVVQNSLNTTIREGQVNNTIQNMLQIVGYKLDTSLYLNVVPAVLRAVVEPNMVIDTETTEQARQEAMDSVESVIYLQGQNIIRQGERVSANQLEMVRALGLLDDNTVDWAMYGAGTIILLFAMAVLVIMMHLMHPQTMHAIRRITVVMLVLVINAALIAASVMLDNACIAPVCFTALLLTGLLSAEEATAGTVCMAVMTCAFTMTSANATTQETVALLLSALVGGLSGVLMLRGKPQRFRVIVVGLLSGLICAAGSVAAVLLSTSSSDALGDTALVALGSGVLSGLLAVALQPVIETIFNLATPSKLLELSNPNQPLLRRLLLEAAGTYHHSIIVGNLAEAAAEEINANPLLARVGAYYHDIGKLKRPLYFKENQVGDNPHDHADPYVSAAIVTTHTRDGLLLAQKHHLPREIQQIIVQHHGDTPVMYFYHKALQEANGKPVDINDFRYDGSRPNTKEAAIIMLADTVEAAVRAMPDHTPQSIEKSIEQLVKGKIEDGQLSESPLTMADIDTICSAFASVLNGVYHERIKYPEVKAPKRSMFDMGSRDHDEKDDAPVQSAPAKDKGTASAPAAGTPEKAGKAAGIPAEAARAKETAAAAAPKAAAPASPKEPTKEPAKEEPHETAVGG